MALSRYVAFAVVFAGIALIILGIDLDAGWPSTLLLIVGGFLAGYGVFGIDVDR